MTDRKIYSSTKYKWKMVLGSLACILLMFLIVSYGMYEEYPKYEHYPIRVKVVKLEYESYWDYLSGNATVVVEGYETRDTVRVETPWHGEPSVIYNEPDL